LPDPRREDGELLLKRLGHGLQFAVQSLELAFSLSDRSED